MSMVKAYNGKKCTDLQLCCSNWTTIQNDSSVDLLTKGIDMEAEDENWLWEKLNKSPKMCNNGKLDSWNSENMKYTPLDPPLQFQDNPVSPHLEKYAAEITSKLISDALLVSCKITWSIPCSQDCHMSDSLPLDNSVLWNGLRLCWTPELLPHNKSPSLNACLSVSHNSLSTLSSSNMDDSSYIKSAVSHDVLTTKQISDMYNVPFDSDIYAVPVDMVQNKCPKDLVQGKKSVRRDRRYHSSGSASDHYMTTISSSKGTSSSQKLKGNEARCNGLTRKQRSVSAGCSSTEPIHVTVEEVRQYLHTLYSSSKESSEPRNFQETIKRLKNPFKSLQNNLSNDENRYNNLKSKDSYIVPIKSKKAKENINTAGGDYAIKETSEKYKASTCRPSFSANIKQTLCNIFRFKKLPSPDHCLGKKDVASRSDEIGMRLSGHDDQNPPSPITKPPFSKRALPPLPQLDDNHGEIIVTDSTPLPSPEEVPPPALSYKTKEPSVSVDFASSIEKVKDYGWYWGPISCEAAEKILSNEPDGSFIVRDSSDDYYIFSLTFKLNSIIRHVRIEHDQGNFSFGSSTRFKSHTIVDFIESAVEHSRSGRYLFFLHRRPVLGPMRVQLLHPVSRFKQVQSLQHMCRFVILKLVRRDLIQNLPLPRRILDYLSTQHYYSEHLMEDDQSDSSVRDDLDQLLSFKQEGFS